MTLTNQVKGYKLGDVRLIIDDQYFAHFECGLDNVAGGFDGKFNSVTMPSHASYGKLCIGQGVL